MNMKNTEKRQYVTFAAIEKTVEESIPALVEDYTSRDYVLYGKDDKYPEYLHGLYMDVNSMHTIINGTCDFVAGESVKGNIDGMSRRVNSKGMTWQELITLVARDWMIYGGYSVQVIRNMKGDISELYYLDYRYCRTDRDNESVYYNPEFGVKWSRGKRMVVYPRFVRDNREVANSVLYVKNTVSSTYPVPRYIGAIKSCEIERQIDTLHLNGLQNGFMSSYLINFNNGVPEDEQKAEIERNVVRKFGGTENAGRIMLSFNDGKENMTTVQKMDVTDFSEKYKAAAERSREQIYAAFRANPQIFGIVSQATGFSKIEYSEAYELFYYSVVRPIQRLIVDNFDLIFGVNGSVEIEPFRFADVEAETVE